jgi:hypothetical protein
MQRNSRVLIALAGASAGLGLFALLDAYWRWIGVALGYPRFLSGLIWCCLLMVGIACFLASRQATAHAGRPPDQVPNAKPPERDERG